MSDIRTSCMIGAVGLAAAGMAVGAVLGLAGCGEPIEPEPPSSVELVAGTADADGAGFVAVEDGADAELRPGAQGGFHVWLNARIQGTAGEMYVERDARRVSDGALVFRGLPQVIEIPLEALDEPWSQEQAAPAFMCPAPVGLQVFDEPLVYEIRLLTDHDEDAEVVASDTVVMVPRCPQDAQNAFCLQICAG